MTASVGHHWCHQGNNHFLSCWCGGGSGQTCFVVLLVECEESALISLHCLPFLLWLNYIVWSWLDVSFKENEPHRRFVAQQIFQHFLETLKCEHVPARNRKWESPGAAGIPSYHNYVRQSCLVKTLNRFQGKCNAKRAFILVNFMKSV